LFVFVVLKHQLSEKSFLRSLPLLLPFLFCCQSQFRQNGKIDDLLSFLGGLTLSHSSNLVQGGSARTVSIIIAAATAWIAVKYLPSIIRYFKVKAELNMMILGMEFKGRPSLFSFFFLSISFFSSFLLFFFYSFLLFLLSFPPMSSSDSSSCV